MPERVFNLPDLGEGLEEAEIVEWKVAQGDDVELNQPLVEVNTAKAVVEIPSPFAGRIIRLHGADGDVVKVGQPLVTMDVEAAAAGSEVASGPPTETSVASEGPEEPPKRQAVLVGYGVDTEAPATRRRPRLRPPGPRQAPGAVSAREAPRPHDGTAAAGPVAASPVVRRLARELGVPLARVEGTGPGGRVTREDVESFASRIQAYAVPPIHRIEGPAHPAAERAPVARPTGKEERLPVRGVRRLVAQKMSRAWTEVPHVTTFRTVDCTHIEAFREELGRETSGKVSPLPIVVRALVEICRDHPKLNSWYDTGAEEIVLMRSYHVGIATDTDRGLMVPVVRDADGKGILTLSREIGELVAAAREGRATLDQLTGSTITVTNVGTFGSEFGTPIVNFPEAAILGLGVIEPRALAVEGKVEARPAVTLSLSFDHRILDGAEAGRAMTALQQLLESPSRLGALPSG